MNRVTRTRLTAIAAFMVLLFVGVFHADAQAVAEQDADSAFDAANEEYKAGRYEDAANLYEGLLARSTVENADIHYNLGNAYFRLNEYGKAIAEYRRALFLSPRDQDILANLRLARSSIRDKLDSPKSTELYRELLFFHYDFSRAESELLFFLAYTAAAGFGILALFWKSRGARAVFLVASAAAIIFGGSTLAHIYRHARPSSGVVIAQEADIHTGPGDTYLTLFSLHDGAELELLKHLDDWRQVELSDGRRGWIKDSSIEIL